VGVGCEQLVLGVLFSQHHLGVAHQIWGHQKRATPEEGEAYLNVRRVSRKHAMDVGRNLTIVGLSASVLLFALIFAALAACVAVWAARPHLLNRKISSSVTAEATRVFNRGNGDQATTAGDSPRKQRPLRLVLIIAGTRGDVQPALALALRLQADGHSVRLVSHAAHELMVRQAGLADFQILGGDPVALTQVRPQLDVSALLIFRPLFMVSLLPCHVGGSGVSRNAAISHFQLPHSQAGVLQGYQHLVGCCHQAIPAIPLGGAWACPRFA
jgi:hypothetical protein